MAAKNFNDDQIQLLKAAIDLAIGSCERRGNRAGEVQAIKDELARQADSYRVLKSLLLAK